MNFTFIVLRKSALDLPIFRAFWCFSARRRYYTCDCKSHWDAESWFLVCFLFLNENSDNSLLFYNSLEKQLIIWARIWAQIMRRWVKFYSPERVTQPLRKCVSWLLTSEQHFLSIFIWRHKSSSTHPPVIDWACCSFFPGIVATFRIMRGLLWQSLTRVPLKRSQNRFCRFIE